MTDGSMLNIFRNMWIRLKKIVGKDKQRRHPPEQAYCIPDEELDTEGPF